jgi:hypothetical protein
MPNLRYTYQNKQISRRLYYIVINDVIVDRIAERAAENRYEYDLRVEMKIALFEEALKVKARKVRGE